MRLDKPYNKIDFVNFVSDSFLSDFIYDERAVRVPEHSLFRAVKQLGVSKDNEVTVLEAICDEADRNKRIAITQDAFRILRNHGISNALIAFSYGTAQWRLSLLTSKLELKDGKVLRNESNPRRFSYLLGKGAKTNTPHKFLVERGKAASLQSLLERFSVEVVNKQFYDAIALLYTELVGGERAGKTYPGLLKIHGNVQANKLQEFAVRLIGRIVFCWFLKEKKSEDGVPLIPDNILSLEAIKGSGEYYHRILEPLFFELLNKNIRERSAEHRVAPYNTIPYLNGGLFSVHDDDHYKYVPALQSGQYNVVTIPDSWFRSLFDLFGQYNFTVDENTSYDVELSIDPEMLGRIFENLLAEINPETGESAKKSTGSFYTPREIVDYMVDASLLRYLQDKTHIGDQKLQAVISYGKEDDNNNPLAPSEKEKLVNSLADLTVLDPACGSGAFPIGILQKVVYILQQTDEDAKLWFKRQIGAVASAELRHDIESKYQKGNFDYLRKLGVIRQSIFGVDIQTIATEIAKLRCYLSLIIEEEIDDYSENRGVRPLPNLDFKFISANSLVALETRLKPALTAGFQTVQTSLLENKDYIKELKRIRDDYFNADTALRSELKKEFQQTQADMLEDGLKNFARLTSDRYLRLSKWKPFDIKSTPWFDPEWMFGVEKFDIVIANPPYIHFEHDKELSEFYKGLGFKTYEPRGDIYALFYEKGIDLLKPKGILCYITSDKWMRNSYGESLRSLLAKATDPFQLIDFAGQQIFDATVETNILLLSKSENRRNTKAAIIGNGVDLNDLNIHIKHRSLTMSFDTGDSWIILSPIEQSIKAKIEALGTPLKRWGVNINRGILTGCNEAFLVNGAKRAELIGKDPKNAEIIRPILRGRDISRYSYEFADQYLILTHNGYININGERFPPVELIKYPTIKKHLDEYWGKISIRTDKGVTPYNLRHSDCRQKDCIMRKRGQSFL